MTEATSSRKWTAPGHLVLRTPSRPARDRSNLKAGADRSALCCPDADTLPGFASYLPDTLPEGASAPPDAPGQKSARMLRMALYSESRPLLFFPAVSVAARDSRWNARRSTGYIPQTVHRRRPRKG